MKTLKRSHSSDTALDGDIRRVFSALNKAPYIFEQTAMPASPTPFDLWDNDGILKFYDGTSWLTISYESDTDGAYVRRDGTTELSAAWDAGAFRITTENLTVDTAITTPSIGSDADNITFIDSLTTFTEDIRIAQNKKISLEDDKSVAFLIAEGANSYFAVATSDDTEALVLGIKGNVSAIQINPNEVTVGRTNSTPYLKFINTGGLEVNISDNSALALLIKEAGNAYITCSTANGAESITLSKDVNVSTGLIYGATGSNLAIDIGNQNANQIRFRDSAANQRILIAFNSGSTGCDFCSFKEDTGTPANQELEIQRAAQYNTSFYNNSGVGENRSVDIYGRVGGSKNYGRLVLDGTGDFVISSQVADVKLDDDVEITGTLDAGASTLDSLNITKGKIVNTTRITGATTLNADHNVVYADTDGGAFTITLPAGVDGTYYRIINVGSSANNVTMAPDGAELLIGVNSNYTLTDGDVLEITYETTEGWW